MDDTIKAQRGKSMTQSHTASNRQTFKTFRDREMIYEQ